MVMKCEEIREAMPDLASGLMTVTPEVNEHLGGCNPCADKFAEFQQTMALLYEWKAPEPSPYFDVRLQARLREEMTKPQAGWLQWFRRPVMAAALTVLMGVGVGLFFVRGNSDRPTGPISSNYVIERGTAVSDLQDLDQNHQLYSDYDVLDDLDVQPDVNP